MIAEIKIDKEEYPIAYTESCGCSSVFLNALILTRKKLFEIDQ